MSSASKYLSPFTPQVILRHAFLSFPVGLSPAAHSGKLLGSTASVGFLPCPAVQVGFINMQVVY